MNFIPNFHKNQIYVEENLMIVYQWIHEVLSAYVYANIKSLVRSKRIDPLMVIHYLIKSSKFNGLVITNFEY